MTNSKNYRKKILIAEFLLICGAIFSLYFMVCFFLLLNIAWSSIIEGSIDKSIAVVGFYCISPPWYSNKHCQ